MTTCLIAFLMAFMLSVILTNGVRMGALMLGWVDRPDFYRKIHRKAVPRLGGIGIFVAFFTPIVILYFFYHNQVSDRLQYRSFELLGLLIGSTVAMGMGVADDLRRMSARWKLLFQIVAGTIAWITGLSIDIISNPFGPPLVLGVFSLPVTVFWFVGCMNAVNLMDGLDGLAAGICLFVSVTVFLVSLLFHNVIGMLLMAVLSGAILGFLIFNFYPARIFLGDSGSMLLGFLVGALSLIGSTRKAETAIALLIPMVALGLPIFDTSLTILRRWYNRFPLASPDRQHVHHVLVSMGYSQRRAVLTLYFTTILLGGAALLITLGRNEVTILVLGSLALIAFVCVRVLGGLRLEDLFDRLSDARTRKRSVAQTQTALDQSLRLMQQSVSIGGLWEACSSAFQNMGLDSATLRLRPEAGFTSEAMAWFSPRYKQTPDPEADTENWSAQLVVSGNRKEYGALTLYKSSLGKIPLAELSELADVLRQEIAQNLVRLAARSGGPAEVSARPATETIDESSARPRKGRASRP